jgi:hypothetical protein
VFRAVRADLKLLFEQVLNGRAIQLTLRRFGSRKPGVANGACRPPVSVFGVRRRIVDELVGHHGSFQGGHDVAQRELVRIARQFVAAMRTADAAHDTDAAQAAEQLIEVGFGDFLARGDFGTLHRALPKTSGKLDDGVSSVVAAHRKSQSKVIPSTLYGISRLAG